MSSAAAALLQLAVILGLAHVMGGMFRKIGQPRVVGEMVAGMLLGPSALGWLAPGLSQVVFPHESLGSVAVLSQLAVVLFVYLIGVRLETEHLRQHSRLAIVTSNVSVFLPFLMGLALAFFLYPQTEQPRGAFLTFALFVGTAISITAFPVLARILEERNLVNTRLGSIAITCAAFGDATAWVLVASIVAMAKKRAERLGNRASCNLRGGVRAVYVPCGEAHAATISAEFGGSFRSHRAGFSFRRGVDRPAFSHWRIARWIDYAAGRRAANRALAGRRDVPAVASFFRFNRPAH